MAPAKTDVLQGTVTPLVLKTWTTIRFLSHFMDAALRFAITPSRPSIQTVCARPMSVPGARES